MTGAMMIAMAEADAAALESFLTLHAADMAGLAEEFVEGSQEFEMAERLARYAERWVTALQARAPRTPPVAPSRFWFAGSTCYLRMSDGLVFCSGDGVNWASTDHWEEEP